MEREEGKLTSQERFWQARLLSKEAEYRKQLTAIHQQLEALKDTTNHAKADLETSQCIPNHNKEENTIVPSTRMVIEKQTKPKILQEHEPFTPSQGEVESQERPDEVIIFLLALHTRCPSVIYLSVIVGNKRASGKNTIV